MDRRTTTGKAALEPVVIGDPALGDRLVAALSATEKVERATHGFHTYPAGMHPDAAREIVRALPGSSVLDPFCGGGTVLVEAMLAGRMAIGSDVSPIAIRLARARTTVLPRETVTRFRSAGRKIAEIARTAEADPPELVTHAVQDWYARHVAWELEAIRAGIAATDAEIRPLLEIAFSSILVKVSYRKSDTSAQREVHDRPRGTTAILFHKKVRELGRMLDSLRDLTPPGTPTPEIGWMDARNLDKGPVDLVLTSPPYPSTYDYVPLQHLRLVWLGLGRAGEEAEIGARRAWREGRTGARREWLDDTARWTSAAARCLNPGGHLVVLVGDGFTPTGDIDTSEATETAGKRAGLSLVARASVEREDFARERSRWEHAFAFVRPG